MGYRSQGIDRILETAASPGTGQVALGGAVAGYRAFSSVLSTGDTCAYFIEAVDANGNPTGTWERGFGTLQAGPALQRVTVIESSAGMATVANFVSNVRVGVALMSDTANVYPQPGGRLSVTTSPIADTSSSTIYYVPYQHNQIPIFNGAGIQIVTISNSPFLSMSVSALAAGTAWDIFAYVSGSTLMLDPPFQWTSPTVRATALAWNNGFLTKGGDPTRRYLGSFYIGAAGTIYDVSATGSSAGNPGKRFLWNAYNRVSRYLYMQDGGANWTSAANGNWRVIRGYTAPNGCVEMFRGRDDEPVHMVGGLAGSAPASGGWFNVAIGLDGINIPANCGWGSLYSSLTTVAQGEVVVQYVGYPGAGYHYLVLLEDAPTSPAPTLGWGMGGGVGLWGYVLA
jgi:hypothetical protein